MQAALRFGHRGLRVVAHFNLSHARPAFQGKHGHWLPIDVQKIQGHGMPPEHFDFDDRLRMFSAAQKFVDAHRRTLAIADAIDYEARTEHAISAGENARSGGH